jgi:hypothetical protein
MAALLLVTSTAGVDSTCQSGHLALWCNLADTMVIRSATIMFPSTGIPIRHPHGDPHPLCDSTGTEEQCNTPFSVLIAPALITTCQSGHLALWCDLADTIIVSHDDVPVPIHCDST